MTGTAEVEHAASLEGESGVYVARKIPDPISTFYLDAAAELRRATYQQQLETKPLVLLGIKMAPWLRLEACARYAEEWEEFCRRTDIRHRYMLHWEKWAEGFTILDTVAVRALNLTEHSQVIQKDADSDEFVRDFEEALHPLRQLFQPGRITAFIGLMGDGKTNLIVWIIRQLLTLYPDDYLVATNIAFKQKMLDEFPQIRKAVYIDEAIQAYREVYAEFVQTGKMKTLLWIMDEFSSAAGKHRGRTIQSISLIPQILQSRKLGLAPVIVVQWASDISDKFRQTRTLKAMVVTGCRMKSLRDKKTGQPYETYDAITDKKKRHKHIEMWLMTEDGAYRKFGETYKVPCMDEYYHHDDPTTLDFTRVNFYEFLKKVTGKFGQDRVDAIDEFLDYAVRETVATISPEEWESLDETGVAYIIHKTPPSILKQHIGDDRRLKPRAWNDDEVEYLCGFLKKNEKGNDVREYSNYQLGAVYGVSDTTVRDRVGKMETKKVEKGMGFDA